MAKKQVREVRDQSLAINGYRREIDHDGFKLPVNSKPVANFIQPNHIRHHMNFEMTKKGPKMVQGEARDLVEAARRSQMKLKHKAITSVRTSGE